MQEHVAASPVAARVIYEETAQLDVAALLDEWGASLDARERARLSGLRFDRDRRDYVAAHALLRLGLREARGRDPWRAVPADRSGWSLAHCDGFVACAFAADPDERIGVDVEPIAAADRLLGITDVFVTPRERMWMSGRAPGTPRERLVGLWAAKEAALKAVGQGLTGPRGLDVLLALECVPGGEVDGWQSLWVEDEHAGDRLLAWHRRVGEFVIAVAGRASAMTAPPRARPWPQLSETIAS